MNNDPKLPSFVEKLNSLGRFILFIHLLFCFATTYYFVNGFMLNAPSGSYPLYFIFGPPFGGTIILYLLCMFLLRKMDIRVDKETIKGLHPENSLKAINHDLIKKLLIQLKEIALKNGDGVYGDLQEAVNHLDSLLESSDISKEVEKLNLLLAPTANLQELSIDRGWGEKFCELAEQIENIKMQLNRGN